MNYLELLKLASPEAVVAITALAVLALGLASARGAGICSAVAAAGILFAAAAVLLLPEQATLFHGMLVITPLTSLFKIICLVLAFFTVILARGDNTPRHHGEYLALLLLATIGLMLLVGSEELLMIFIGLELTGLSLYVMAGFDKTDPRSAEAGLKYFLFGSTASAFTLFGLSLVYGMCGTTGLAAIGQKLTAGPIQPLLAAGIVMTLIGFAFKIAAAPFHLWAPDAYQGAPIPSAAFIASGSKVASFVVLGKIVLVGFGPAHGSAAWHAMIAGWAPVLAALAALSIVIGNLVALAQSNVRRLLAYSAVAHAGYTLLGLVAGGREGFRCHALLHHGLCLHAGRALSASSRWCAAKPAATTSRIFPHSGRARLCSRGAWRSSCFPWPACRRWLGFWKVLPLQRRDARRPKPRPALACRTGAAWQFHLALLLPRRAQGDFRR